MRQNEQLQPGFNRTGSNRRGFAAAAPSLKNTLTPHLYTTYNQRQSMLLLRKGAVATGTVAAAVCRKRPRLPVAPLRLLASSSSSSPLSPPTVTLHRQRPPTAMAQDHDNAHALFAPLAQYLGVEKLEPGRVLDLSKQQLIELLTTQNQALAQALYALAEAATSTYRRMVEVLSDPQ